MNNATVVLLTLLVVFAGFLLFNNMNNQNVQKTRNVNVVRNNPRHQYYPSWDNSIFNNSYWWPQDSWRFRGRNPGPLWRPGDRRRRRFH